MSMDNQKIYDYIVFLTGVHDGTRLAVPVERLAYAFHTFSLHHERVYEPTGDVTFVSPNPDARDLDGGVERLVAAVLHLPVTAHVMRAEEVEKCLSAAAAETAGTMIALTPDLQRRRRDLQALVALARATKSQESHAVLDLTAP